MYISEGLSDFVNNSFKLVCKEYIMKLSDYNRLPFEIEEEGEWVGKMGTLDIVAQSETGDTLVGICEWSKKMDLDSLEFIRTCSKRARISPDYYYLFSAVGFDDALVSIAQDSSSIKLISLDDLMKG